MSEKKESANKSTEELRRLGYERRDVVIPSIVSSGFWMTLGIVVLIGGTWLMLSFMHPDHLKAESDIAGKLDLPPDLKLQSNQTAVTDIHDLRREQHRDLTTYKLIDKERGIVRVPIDIAMQMYLKKSHTQGEDSLLNQKDSAQSSELNPGIDAPGQDMPSDTLKDTFSSVEAKSD